MAHRMSGIAVLAVLLSGSLALYAQFPQIPGFGNKSNNASGLDDTKIASGLKEALSVGTSKAVKQVAKPGGYLDNAAIKILLPQNLRPVEKVLRAAGQGPKIDGFIASMNHAAESAAPEAGTIFGNAVQMPWPVSTCGTATVMPPSRPILMKLPNVASPRSADSSLVQRRGQTAKATIRPMPAPPPISRVRRSMFNGRIGPSTHGGRSCRCRAAAAVRRR